MSMGQNVLIVGASSAVGGAIAHRLAAGRDRLILAGRDVEELRRDAADLGVRYGAEVVARRFEALDFASHAEFFRSCVEQFGGGLDGVVLCHGFLPDQAEARRDFAVARRVIDVNYSSAVSVLELAADYFERRRRGYICGVTSVAGDRGRRSNYLYGSAKAALGVYLQGLRHRLAEAGVPVIAVKPGFVDTRTTYGLVTMPLVASPSRVATDICRAIRRGTSVIYTPWFWRGIMAVIRVIPNCLFHRTRL